MDDYRNAYERKAISPFVLIGRVLLASAIVWFVATLLYTAGPHAIVAFLTQ